MRLIDSHAHLQVQAFEHDRASVLAAARDAGVERLLLPGYDVESSRAALEMSVSLSVDAAAGIHPHVAARASDADWAAIETLVFDPRVVAAGETGLDYDRGYSPRDVQLANLERHLVLGGRVGKPVILHCRSKPGRRDAQDDLLGAIEQAGAPGAVLHSFSGPVDYALRALEMGSAISFSGLVFRGGEEASADVARLVPLDRLLVETDSPYLSPPGANRRRNEPRWVGLTADWLARQRQIDLEALGEQLVSNYDAIFSRRRA